MTELVSVIDAGNTDVTADFVLDANDGMVRRRGIPNDWFERNLDCGWPRFDLTVQYSGGYALPDSVPLPLQQACLTMIKHRWSARTRSTKTGRLTDLLRDTHVISPPSF